MELREIPQGEYRDRIQRFQMLLSGAGLDGALLFDNDNIRYYTGFVKASYGATYLWRRAVYVPRMGDPVFISPQIIYSNVVSTTWVDDVRPWGGPSFLGYPATYEDIVVSLLRDLRVTRVGMELADTMHPELSLWESDELRRRLDPVEVVDCCDPIWRQRMVKTDFELGIIRDLASRVTRAMGRAFSMLKRGMTEYQFHGLLWRAFVEEGIHEDPMAGRMMMSGPGRYGMFIMGPTQTPLANDGDGLFIDGGPRYRGYFCDIQRNFVIGKPSVLQEHLYHVAREATDRCIQAIRPGIRASDIYRIANDVLTREGLEMPIGFVGHGIGLYTHEPPYMTETNDQVLEEGMYLAVEVGALDKPLYRVVGGFPEENLIITKTGCDVLTLGIPGDLQVIGK